MGSDFINKALAGAKAAVATANKKFPDLAKTPYSVARSARSSDAAKPMKKSDGVDYNPIHTAVSVIKSVEHPEGESVAAGLKAVRENVNQYAHEK